MKEALLLPPPSLLDFGLFIKKLFTHHGLNYYHQFLYGIIKIFMTSSFSFSFLVLYFFLALGYTIAIVPSIRLFEAICLELFISLKCLRRFFNQP
jgi:hypothetical protein